MAERRMFAKTIVDSDAFIDMPVTARLLYYDLGMRADDDGFVNSPKKIMRMIGASQDDLNILIYRKFIIPFENGVVVIKHWKIHNYIRQDTYKETPYKEQKMMLEYDENKAYRLAVDGTSTERQQVVDGTWTQDRIGKDRIGKDRLEENTSYSLSTGVDPQPKITAVEVVNLYHDICKSYPRVRSISDNRRKAINARLRTHSMDEIKEVFEKAEKSPFLKGSNKRNWSANFDWLMNDTNFCKVLDGNYDDKSYTARIEEREPENRPIPTEEEFDIMFGKKVDNG